jgi:hypothetical protein
MSVIKYSISLEEQPGKTIYKENPSSYYLGTIDYEVDSSEYEEYSFTGNKNEIDSRFTTELGAGGANWQVQATKTRLNGNLWELKIRKNKIHKKDNNENDITNEQKNAQEAKWGSELAPRQTSVSITALQQSILNHKRFESYPPENLAAVKMYMNGASPGEKVGTSSGVLRLDELMHITDKDVQFAIKNPTYYVPSMSVTYSYWSASKKTDMSDIGEQKNPPGIKPPKGYTSVFMGINSSPLEKGYKIEETYIIGKFNKELFEDDSES